MATQKFINNFDTTVAATFGASDTFLQLASAAGLPTLSNGDWFTLTIYKLVGVVESVWETVKVTAVTGTQATVERSYEGAAAAQFDIGDRVSARWTAKAAGLKADQTDVDTKLSKTTPDTMAATLTLAGSASQLAAIIANMAEKVKIDTTAPSGNVPIDVTTNSIVYHTANATANWGINLRGNSTNTLNSIMAIGQALTIAMITTQGTTAYYPTVFQIDGTAVTPKWQGGTAPVQGNASSLDVYALTVIKTANNVFTVMASQSQFK